MGVTDRPVVIDFIVHQDAMVWPMVAAGTSNDDIKIARDTAPVFDYEIGEVDETIEKLEGGSAK
jgi:acetolactate synthase I/II/III large subunit